MNIISPMLYRGVHGLVRAALGFYFARIELFHPERVPLVGPALFASNHPNSLADAFVIATTVSRKVNFVATVQLFRFRALRWLLTQCGVIPINRAKDDPRAMRTVMDTFQLCHRVLERGEAIGIFPEGITHDDPQLKTVKTGTARMALDLEHRHGGRLGLQVVPVGLTFSAKEIYRSEVLVHFGEPIRVADFLAGYAERRHECIQRLSAEIERRIQALIIHLPRLERARVVEAVKRLHLDRLRVGSRVIQEPVLPRAGELLLTQAIAAAVEYVYEHQPERAAAFVRKLDRYERWLRRLRLPDDLLARLPARGWLLGRNLVWALVALVGAPVALYGWIHRWAPVAFITWAVRRFAKVPPDRTHVATVSMVSGLVGFGVCYGLFIAVVHRLFGWPVSLWYGLSLPVTSLVAHYYVRGLRRLAASVRAVILLLRAPWAANRLVTWRRELIDEIEAARQQMNRGELGNTLAAST